MKSIKILQTLTLLITLVICLNVSWSTESSEINESTTPIIELAEAKETYIAGCKFLEARNNLCSCVWSRLENRYKAEELIAIHKTNQYPENYKPFVKNVIHHCVRGY